jgi:hypothetical protein
MVGITHLGEKYKREVVVKLIRGVFTKPVIDQIPVEGLYSSDEHNCE